MLVMFLSWILFFSNYYFFLRLVNTDGRGREVKYESREDNVEINRKNTTRGYFPSNIT